MDAPESIAEALAWLRQGEVVAFPTDTLYGIGVAMDQEAAIERLYVVKGRPQEMGLPLLLAAVKDLEAVCQAVPAVAWRLAERFWPGGLTLILWKRPRVPDRVTGGRPSVAVRLPDHPVPRELARQLGRPLASSSANRWRADAPTTAAQVLVQLGERIPLVLDGGSCPKGQPSTILDLTVNPPTILREGAVARDALESLIEGGH